MPTILESYQAGKNNFDTGIQTAAPSPSQIWVQQETIYRIEVLETCQMFAKTAPQSVEAQILVSHYQMVDAYIQNLTSERRYGISANDEIKKQRETAYNNLLRVIQDYRARFGSFTPGGDTGCYRKTISKVIQTILPVWIQYRQTYIEISREGL